MVDPPLRVLVCSGNLGNAPPDPASMAAWIPENGSVKEVVEHQSQSNYPLPSPNVWESFYQDMGLSSTSSMDTDTNNIQTTNSSAQDNSNKISPRRESDGLTSSLAPGSDNPKKEEEIDEEEQFDIIVIGMQEATFVLEEVEKELPQLLPVLQPLLQKAARKAKKAAQKADATVTQFTKSKDYASEKSTSTFLNVSEPFQQAKSAVGLNSEKEPTLRDGQIIQDLIADRLPSYKFVTRFQRGEMRLEILVKKSLKAELTSVKAQNTGLVNLGANKGGIVGSLIVHQTRLSFVTAHLEAHEGNQKYKHRCQMLHDILEGTADESLGPKYDVSVKSHYCFVLGDLNFRTELLNHEELSKSEHNDEVRALVQQHDWWKLNQADELFRGLREKDLAVGFQTLPCMFPPTFKVERQQGFVHKEQRRPSYTDRILWKCNHKLEGRVRPLAYEPIEEFQTSDHKPIRGAFEIQPNELIVRSRPALQRRGSMADLFRRKSKSKIEAPSVREYLHLFINNIRCDLKGKEKGSKYTPYVAFVSDPKALIKQEQSRFTKAWSKVGINVLNKKERDDGGVSRTVQGWPRTRKIASSNQPDWGDDQIHLVVKTHDKNGEAIDHSGSFLYLTVIDHNPSIDTLNVIGSFALNLAHVCTTSAKKRKVRQPGRRASMMWSQKPEAMSLVMTEFNEELLLKNGKEKGTISCTLDACWVDNSSHNASRAMKKLEHESKLRASANRSIDAVKSVSMSAATYTANSVKKLNFSSKRDMN